MTLNTNITAMAAARNLTYSQDNLSTSLSRLSSGSKIIQPADNAAGLAVSSRLDAQIKRLDAAKSNLSNAVSFMQTQDGYLQKIGKALDRMSELAMMAQDMTKSDSDRALYQQEFVQMQDYISNTASKEFNGVSLFSNAVLGITTDDLGTMFSMDGVDLTTTSYTAATDPSTVNVNTTTAAATALVGIRAAISSLAADRANIGAYQSRVNHTIEQLQVSKENLTAATSRIKDVDVAEEATEFARYNILVQSGTAMLAQANSVPQNVLKLLQ